MIASLFWKGIPLLSIEFVHPWTFLPGTTRQAPINDGTYTFKQKESNEHIGLGPLFICNFITLFQHGSLLISIFALFHSISQFSP